MFRYVGQCYCGAAARIGGATFVTLNLNAFHAFGQIPEAAPLSCDGEDAKADRRWTPARLVAP